MTYFTNFVQKVRIRPFNSRIEHSIENILCWKDVQLDKRNPSLEIALKIQEKYLNGSRSEFEINISRKELGSVEHMINTGECYEDSFSTIEQIVLMNLSDAFSRFQWTSEYERYIEQKTFFNEVSQEEATEN
jgi:hypothetical protein